METKIINGKQIAQEIQEELRQAVSALREQGRRAPKLTVVLVGNDPASEVYIRGKHRASRQIGIESKTVRLPESASEKEVLQVIQALNQDPEVNGILVQLPLPAQISVDRVIQAIHPDKDVDGFHVWNIGHLTRGDSQGFLPCTPSGILELLHRSGEPIEGKRCVVVGRSNLVGKPTALLLLEANGTVTVCHSYTKDLASVCREADILVVAAGQPGLIKGSMIQTGSVVIDVGIHRLASGLCGDVDTESCLGIAGAITPVPGGVGPMTVVMLMKNCLQAYHKQNSMDKLPESGRQEEL